MKRLMSLILIVFVLSSFSGCLNRGDDNSNNSKEFSFHYRVDIKTNQSSEYEIYIPVLITPILAENDDNISEIMNKITINGIAKCNIINSDYGKALSINGTGTISINANGDENLPLARFNLLYDSDNDGLTNDERGDVKYWIYFNTSSSVSLEIHFSQNNYSFIYIKAEDISENGWILIDGIYLEGAP